MTHPNTAEAPVRLPTVIPPHLDELSRRIFRVAMVWKAALEDNITTEGLDGIVPSGAGLVLFALFERDGWTVGELAKRARVSHVAVLHVIQRIEEAGLVQRKTCPDDKRVTRVWLTPRGRELEPGMQTLHKRNLETFVGILGTKDAVKLGELLERLMAGLSERCAESSGSSVNSRPKR